MNKKYIIPIIIIIFVVLLVVVYIKYKKINKMNEGFNTIQTFTSTIASRLPVEPDIIQNPTISQHNNQITYLSDTVNRSNNNINTLRFTAIDNQDRLNNIVKRMNKIKKELVNTTNDNKTKNNFIFY